MHRKIPFENVLNNLKMGRYRGKISSIDYANTGHQLFNRQKFTAQLGKSEEYLREIGLLKNKDFSGWNLTAEPTAEELMSVKELVI